MNRICILIFVCVCAGSELAFAQQQVVADATPPNAESAQAAPTLNFQVLQSWRADMGTHAIIYNRVAPPVVSGTVAMPAPTPAMSPEMLQWLQARAQKKYKSVSLSVTVFDHQYSQLRWFENGKKYRAFSNIDFGYFEGIGELETSDTIYGFVLFVGNTISNSLPSSNTELGWLAQARQRLSPLLLPPTVPSSYVMVEGSASDTTVIDAMHTFYDSNYEQLIQKYQQRMAAFAEHERELRELPPALPKDTIINFWPKKSTAGLVP